VLDSGGGIAEADLAKVFDPFFTTKPVGEGLGLGLAVSYGIVHDAGGACRPRTCRAARVSA
jgi:two-component system C4-dicarboxylate transport sensor histidine kinase DctB